MSVLGNVFNIVIFVSLVGSVFSVLSLLAKKVLNIALPLWFGVCGIGFYLIPLILPTLRLVPPESTSWIYGYQVACLIWISGATIFGMYFATRSLLACRALKKYRICEDKRVNRVYRQCMATSGLRKTPVLYFGALKDPACVVVNFRPAVILNESVINHLTDRELAIILCHELTHIKRNHNVYQRIFEFVSIVHWANPFVWISKNDFAVHCEMDCDHMTLHTMDEETTGIEYAATMLHLMELSSYQQGHKAGSLGALGFLLAKQRLGFILNEPITIMRRIICITVLAIFLILTATFSIYASRSHFYPYPSFGSAPEYSDSLSS